MTLGAARAGNSTSDNVSPLHLINIKRLAYAVDATQCLKNSIGRYRPAAKSCPPSSGFLATRGFAPKAAAPSVPPEPPMVDFRLRRRRAQSHRASRRRFFIGPKTIVTPSARDLAGPHDILIVTK